LRVSLDGQRENYRDEEDEFKFHVFLRVELGLVLTGGVLRPPVKGIRRW
jgi:hypothetical protein